MSLISYIFILYIIISLLNRIVNQKRRSYSLMQKEKDDYISVSSESPHEAGSPEDKINIKQVDNMEKKDKIIIDDEVKKYYKDKYEDKKKEVFAEKEAVEDEEEISSGYERGMEVYLTDNIIVNGIMLSEIIAPPRALRPYDFRRHRK